MAFLCMRVTNACSQSLESFPVSYNCWKICVIMGAICFAVSLRTLAGSSSGPCSGLGFPTAFLCHLCQFGEEDVGVNRGRYLEDGVLFLGKIQN